MEKSKNYYVGIGALELAHYVPPLVRAVLYDILQGGEDATGAVCGAVLHKEQVFSQGIVDEGRTMGHKKLHNPIERGNITLDFHILVNVLCHRSENYGSKIHVKNSRFPTGRTSGR